MTEYLAGLTSAERVYALCAFFGGGLFVLRTLLTLIGGFSHGVGDHLDLPGHGDAPAHADVSGEADSSFRALSIQGITAFFMMFGLVGLALSRQSHLGVVVSSLGGVAAGACTVWIIGKIFMSMQKMQSDGTLHMDRAIGQEGTVYLTIPADGKGQVSIVLQQQLRMCEAVSADKQPIKTGARVVVVDVLNEHVLVVSKAG